MPRPQATLIESGATSWDRFLNKFLEMVTEAPFPIFLFEGTLAELEVAYPANDYEQCTCVRKYTFTNVSGTVTKVNYEQLISSDVGGSFVWHGIMGSGPTDIWTIQNSDASSVAILNSEWPPSSFTTRGAFTSWEYSPGLIKIILADLTNDVWTNADGSAL